jgi:hypothetical protein
MGAASPGGGLFRRGIQRIGLRGRRIEFGAGESGSVIGGSSCSDLGVEETVGRGSGPCGAAVGPWALHPPASASSGAGSGGLGSTDGGSSCDALGMEETVGHGLAGWGADPPELAPGLGSAGHGDARGSDGMCLGARRVVLGGGDGRCSIRRRVGPAGAVGVRR